MSDNNKNQDTNKQNNKQNNNKQNNKQNTGKQQSVNKQNTSKPITKSTSTTKKPVKISGSSDNKKNRNSPINDFVDRLRDDKKFAAIVVGGTFAACVIIILLCVFVTNPKDEDDSESIVTEGVYDDTTDEAVSGNEATGLLEGEQTVDEGEAAEGEVADDTAAQTETSTSPTDMVNSLVETYFASLASGDVNTITAIKNKTDEEELLKIQKKSAYIESFENVNVYTKPGPVDNSYVAFVYYEIKFKDLNTLAPGLITLYMSAGEDGNLRIYDGQLDEQLDESVTDYIKELAVTDEIVALFDKVKVKYNEAVDSDPDLKAFIEGLSDRLEAEVAAAMAESQPAEETTETTEQTTEATSQTTETVVATDTVNVRSSDSENADKLGKLEIGTKVTRYEAKGNGWSKIDYNGQEAYVKSEYLKVDDGSSATQTETQTQETEQTDNSASTGDKVTVKETVKVRKTASTDGEVLATAYMGEQFELVMKQADGWTKIKYNGQTAYIKSEFVE